VNDEDPRVERGPGLDKLLSEIQRKVDVLSLLGKDYLDELEAAHYACVSLRQFQMKAAEYRLQPTRFMGKKVYRKKDLQRAMEEQWQRFGRG
jgi:hypothetical protein